MDPGDQPEVLKVLTQEEEMLIARVNPILHVTHAHGGQYKYSRHIICFSQDVAMVAKTLPHHVEYLGIIVVRRHNTKGKYYDCYVNRS